MCSLTAYSLGLIYDPNRLQIYFIDYTFIISPNDLVLGIEVKSTSRLIETVAVRNIDWTKRLAEAAVFIRKKAQWDKGYGTEAMKLLLKIGLKNLT